MIWITNDKAAAMTADELFKARESLARSLAAPAVFRPDIMLDFEKTCAIQIIENELEKRGAISFAERMY